MNSPNPKSDVSTNNGFALVVTLSLMVLLTLIAVGLLSVSAIALRSSSQGDANAIARANARLALMLAIGELQKEMGPDSRISAPPDAGTDAKNGKPRWTAVFDAWQAPADPNTPETPASRVVKFRNWLVSGANQATGGIPGFKGETVKLVTKTNSLPSTAVANDEIEVPLHGLLAGNNMGRLGWWVSDESTKAKINAGPNADPAFKPLFDAQSPCWADHKAIPALNGFTWKPGQRSMASSLSNVNLAASLGSSGIGRINHDVTVQSFGVLSDVRTGRLKRDLSSLLSRPVDELKNMPLYLLNGRINRFTVTDSGAISNVLTIPVDPATDTMPVSTANPDIWGIQLEELHLFHEIHREVDWSGGKPQLVNKGNADQLINDRFLLYRLPSMEAANVMLSFIAEPDGGVGTYKIAAMMDAMCATSNPNDIPIVWPSGLPFKMKMEGFPYRPKWNIRTATNVVRHNHTVAAINRPFFQSTINGGFTLDPGEAAVFGASETDTRSRSVNLTRGYKPRGGVRIEEPEWSTDAVYDPATDGLRADKLKPDDIMDFTMTTASFSNGNTPSGWLSCFTEVRSSSADVRLSLQRLAGGNNSVLTTAPINTYLPSQISPPQKLRISQFIGKPLPVMMATTMPNVEKSRIGVTPPNAFSSRPYQLHEPAVSSMIVSTAVAANIERTMQSSQLVVTAETMDYEFGSDRTMPAGAGGRNLYHGAAREVGLGGSMNVIKRRIALAPPLSIGAFENAIACGLTRRLVKGGSFSGVANTTPALAKAIGNSWINPFLAPGDVYAAPYHDTSWMANTALWDSWFLSGIVDDRSLPSSSWAAESRSPKQQFSDFAKSSANLRNTRFAYNPHASVDSAITELFSGDTFKPAAINKLPKYLVVDGAFNVNSTSEQSWKAFLCSVRDQELYVSGGGKQKFGRAFGTLGYAYDPSSTNDWTGMRDLSDSDITTLAKNIVVEVKSRGPFLSMADFVNRRPNSSDATARNLGALQTAIDKSGLNNRYTGNSRTVVATDYFGTLAGGASVVAQPVPARAIGSAGFLSQGALLSSLGAQVTVRGDTFILRTYGDARDKNDKVLAQAWCEAVVQRLPEYVDSANAPEAPVGTETLSETNKTFGRKFEMVSFRWLTSKEI